MGYVLISSGIFIAIGNCSYYPRKLELMLFYSVHWTKTEESILPVLIAKNASRFYSYVDKRFQTKIVLQKKLQGKNEANVKDI